MTMPEYDTPEYWSLYSQQSWDHYSDTLQREYEENGDWLDLDYDDDDPWDDRGDPDPRSWEAEDDAMTYEPEPDPCKLCLDVHDPEDPCPDTLEDALVAQVLEREHRRELRTLNRRNTGVTGQGYRRDQRSRQRPERR